MLITTKQTNKKQLSDFGWKARTTLASQFHDYSKVTSINGLGIGKEEIEKCEIPRFLISHTQNLLLSGHEQISVFQFSKRKMT